MKEFSTLLHQKQLLKASEVELFHLTLIHAILYQLDYKCEFYFWCHRGSLYRNMPVLFAWPLLR